MTLNESEKKWLKAVKETGIIARRENRKLNTLTDKVAIASARKQKAIELAEAKEKKAWDKFWR